jgi:hypothetical protein
VQGRQHSADDSREQRGRESESDHGAIDIEAQPGQREFRLTQQRLLPVQAGLRQCQRDERRCETEHRGLRKQLHDQARAAGAKRDTHGQFLTPAQRSREQQVRGVRAGNQQHHQYRGEHHAEHRAHRAIHDHVLERLDAPVLSAEPFGIGVHGVIEPRAESGLELDGADPRVTAQHEPVCILVRFDRLRQRRRDPDRFAARVGEILRHHADDRRRVGIDADLAADNGPVAAVAILPKLVREHRHLFRARLFVCRVEVAAKQRCDAEHAEQVRADVGAVVAFRTIKIAQVDRRARCAGDIGDTSEMKPAADQVLAGDRENIAESTVAKKAGLVELLGCGERQRPQHEAVEKCQHEHDTGQARREHADDHGRKSGIGEDRAQRLA